MSLPIAAHVERGATLGDVDSAEALAVYQAEKRARKASLRAAQQGGSDQATVRRREGQVARRTIGLGPNRPAGV